MMGVCLPAAEGFQSCLEAKPTAQREARGLEASLSLE